MRNIDELRAAAQTSKAWPFEEARKLVARGVEGRPAIFETGYGPSGLPHIGTFQEVARTTYVRRAYELLTGGAPTRLIAFSDDMDGLRKVPDNLPGGDMLRANLGKPLTRIPDPFGKFESFAHHNNAMLRDFLDRFGFDYEFLSATDCYTAGRFDATLLKILANYDAVIDVILPTLGPERRATYAPFLPICPKTGIVLQVPLIARDPVAGTVSYIDPNDGERMTVPVTGGAVKCQWKVDWAMRWLALGVDYEMAGKDLIDSVTLSSRIVKILGARPPEGFNYELFLDANGEKISKSRGNGLTIEEWLTYASPESLAFYIYREPRKAKKLSFDVIPKSVDEYYQFLANFPAQPPEQQLGNPVFHIHEGDPPQVELPISFALLLNLVVVASSDDRDIIWGFISRYVPGASPETHPELDRLVTYAIAYQRDFIAPTLARRAPTDIEAKALADLDARLAALPADADAEAIQFEVYEAGKVDGFDNLREWFKAVYETLLGSSQGPRMGSFIALYGIANTRQLIAEALAAVRH
jgi:lysyl-tRNA synthetase class 1